MCGAAPHAWIKEQTKGSQSNALRAHERINFP
jgi:hypothetical protein